MVDGAAHQVQMELRNLPRARVLGYLELAGGRRADAETLVVQGDGWAARLDPLPPARVGVMSIRRDLLVIEGQAAAVARVHAFMRNKTMRGGG